MLSCSNAFIWKRNGDRNHQAVQATAKEQCSALEKAWIFLLRTVHGVEAQSDIWLLPACGGAWDVRYQRDLLGFPRRKVPNLVVVLVFAQLSQNKWVTQTALKDTGQMRSDCLFIFQTSMVTKQRELSYQGFSCAFFISNMVWKKAKVLHLNLIAIQKEIIYFQLFVQWKKTHM